MGPPWRLETTNVIPKMKLSYESTFKTLLENAIGIEKTFRIFVLLLFSRPRGMKNRANFDLA